MIKSLKSLFSTVTLIHPILPVVAVCTLAIGCYINPPRKNEIIHDPSKITYENNNNYRGYDDDSNHIHHNRHNNYRGYDDHDSCDYHRHNKRDDDGNRIRRDRHNNHSHCKKGDTKY